MLGGRLLFRLVRVRLATWVACAALLAPAAASANGDPASDVLLEQKVYYPVAGVSIETENELTALVEKANAAGYAIRVALIHDKYDLGTVPDLLMKPQQYAEFLGPEIRFAYKGDLLVVMPNGLGLTSTDESAPPAQAIKGLKIEAGGSAEGLVETAGIAVERLAEASGNPIGGGGDGGGGTLVGILVALGLLVLGVVGAVWVRRSQPS
jgi:hypothetical protein